MNIVVIDDTAVSRNGLAAALAEAGHEVRTAATTGEAMALIQSDVDLIIADLYLSGPRNHPSLEGIATLAKTKVPVVVYSTWALDSDILAVLAQGAATYVQKGPSLDPLIDILKPASDTAVGSEPLLTPEVAGAMRRREQFGLTTAETDVLRHLSLHMTNSEIAEARFTSQETVKVQVTSIRTKLQAGTRGAAVRNARRLGLIGAWYVDE